MKITLSSVLVDDQDRALAFYTKVLGFVKRTDVPAGRYRWLTVVSPEGPEDVESSSSSRTTTRPPGRIRRRSTSREAPATAFAVGDIRGEHE